MKPYKSKLVCRISARRNERKDIFMKRTMATIKFDYRYEVQELMKMIDKFIKQNPSERNNKVLENFFDLLDAMDLEW